jgi:acyl-CoA synthetase (AMP-forming)/AMP-acid ligase II/acyl carrier protein
VEHPYLDLPVADADRPALLVPGGTRRGLTHGALRTQIEAIARSLVERGVQAGDAIGVVGPGGPELALAFLGVSTVAAAAPVNPSLRPAELAFEIADLSMRAVVVSGPSHPIEEEAGRAGIAVLRLDPVGDDDAIQVALSGPDLAAKPADRSRRPYDPDVALLLHTSGTTARPKIVPLSGANLAASASAVATALGLTPDDVGVEVMPLFHVHGLVAGLLAGLRAGGAVVCTAGFHAPDAGTWWQTSEGPSPTWLTAVPTMHQSLAERLQSRPTDAPGRPLRFLRSSSAALPSPVLAAVEATFGAPLVEAYGMTEAAHQIASNRPDATRRPGTVGRGAGADIVVHGDGGPLPEGEVGEVMVRGAGVTRGYVTDDPEVNRDAFTDGWFRTGDLGRLDGDGFLTLTGRSKEQINRGGEKISPREIDEVLLAHPAVSQAVAFAVPDPRLGEEVAAAVVLDAGAAPSERDLRLFVSTRLAAHKVPRRVVVLDELPKGPTGKVVRIGVAGRLGLDDPRGLDGADRGAGGAPVAPSTDVERFVAGLWREVLGLDHEPGVHDHFLDLGGDSMAASRLLAAVGDRLDLEVTMLDLYDLPTVAQQAGLLEELLTATADDR